MTTDPTTLDLLRAAVKAKLDYWDANSALETHLGFPQGCNDDHPDPDAVCEVIEEEISSLASSYPEGIPGMSAITDEHVAYLNLQIQRAS